MKKLSPTQRKAVEFLKEPNSYITACYDAETMVLNTGFVFASIKVMNDAETPLLNMFKFLSVDGNYTNRHASITAPTARCISALLELVEVLSEAGEWSQPFGAFRLKAEFKNI